MVSESRQGESQRLEEETKEQWVDMRVANPSVHSWPKTKAVRTQNKYTTGQVGRKRKERNKSHYSESWEEIRSSLSSRCKFGRKRETTCWTADHSQQKDEIWHGNPWRGRSQTVGRLTLFIFLQELMGYKRINVGKVLSSKGAFA